MPAASPRPAGGFPVRLDKVASPRLIHTGGEPAIATTSGSNLDTVATVVYIAEIQVPFPVAVTGIAVFNGTAAAGNTKVGLADVTGAVIATSAAVAASGNTAYQRIPFTEVEYLQPGTYYVLVFNDATGDIRTHTVGNFGAASQTGQVFATGFTTITPPTTFTTAVGPIATLY